MSISIHNNLNNKSIIHLFAYSFRSCLNLPITIISILTQTQYNAFPHLIINTYWVFHGSEILQSAPRAVSLDMPSYISVPFYSKIYCFYEQTIPNFAALSNSFLYSARIETHACISFYYLTDLQNTSQPLCQTDHSRRITR